MSWHGERFPVLGSVACMSYCLCSPSPAVDCFRGFQCFAFASKAAVTLLVGGSFCVAGSEGDAGSGSVCPLRSAEIMWILWMCEADTVALRILGGGRLQSSVLGQMPQ